MTNNISRRDFLKLTGAMYLASSMPSVMVKPQRAAGSDLPNILVVVFDAFSARNIELYGYDRPTTPNLSRLASRATVYHNHYAGGNYTFPGTSSLLTGTYPFTHRGFNPRVGIAPFFEQNNLFTAFDQYYRLSYTHNSVAFTLLTQLKQSMDKLKARQDLFLGGDLVSDILFANDEDLASVSWRQAMVKTGRKGTYSLFLAHLYRAYKQNLIKKYTGLYPRGIPNIRDDNYFLLEDAIDWSLEQVTSLPQPFLGYFHYLPPHDPYFTRHDFIDHFKGDGYRSIEKPEHIFTNHRGYQDQENERRWYDEFILLVDAEFGRMFDQLEQTGVLDNTIVVFTSDHGEMFERGITKHYNESLHMPIIQVPLLIFEPGQTSRRDVYSPTSNADLMPTLLQMTGQPVPEWVEGEVLPTYHAGEEDPQRSVFAAEAKSFERQYGEINPGSFMIVKDGYKLTHYTGWEQLNGGGPLTELYDIENDPEEMDELSSSQKGIAGDLLNKLKDKVEEGNQKSLDYR
ncbi:MAG: sulfatase-like hydrolase/transferase [Chloroflexota bacterium]